MEEDRREPVLDIVEELKNEEGQILSLDEETIALLRWYDRLLWEEFLKDDV